MSLSSSHSHIALYLLLLTLSARCMGESQRTNCAITIRKSNPGRVGNQIIPWIKARWIAEIFSIPYLHRNFPYANMFPLHHLERAMPHKAFQGFSRTIEIKSIAQLENDLSCNRRGRTLYIVNLLTVPQRARGGRPEYTPEFLETMRTFLLPNNTSKEKISAPEGYKTVGLHIRTGGSAAHIYNLKTKRYETRDASTIGKGDHRYILDKDHKKNYPTKFLPLPFYVHQLKRLSELCPGEKLYCYIFTDDNNPQQIKEGLEKQMGGSNLQFGCRSSNRHDENVLDDLKLMSRCDYLIRSESTLAVVAELLGQHAIVISPLVVSKGAPPVDKANVVRHEKGKPMRFASKYL